MRQFLYILIASALMLFGVLPVLATPPQPYYAGWEWRSKIEVSPSTPAGYVALDIPSEFFSYLKADLSDLRIGAGDYNNTPYVLGVEQETNRAVSIRHQVFNLSSIPGESTSFVVGMGAAGGRPH